VSLIDREKVHDLKEMAGTAPQRKKSMRGGFREGADPFWEWFRSNTVEIAEYDGSGFLYVTLLVYLEQRRGVDLLNLGMKEVSNYLSEKRPHLMILITPEEATRLAMKLEPSKFSVEDVMRFYEEFDEQESPPATNIVEAVRMLYDGMQKVGPGQVMIFKVG